MRLRVALVVLAGVCCASPDADRASSTPDSSLASVSDRSSPPGDTTDPIPRGIDWARDLDSLAPNPFPPPSADWVARFDGLGPVTVGLSVAAATARYGAGYAPPPGTEGCDYVRIPGGPVGALVMIERDSLVRIDITDARIATDRGVRIGDTETDVRRAYGGLVRQESHPYSGPEWHYLVVTPAQDSTRRIIFETNGWRVISYRVGLAKQVGYIEGCL